MGKERQNWRDLENFVNYDGKMKAEKNTPNETNHIAMQKKYFFEMPEEVLTQTRQRN